MVTIVPNAMRKFLFLVPLCVLGSCKDDEIRTYRVATDTSSESPASAVGGSRGDAAQSESVVWQAPDDWKPGDAGQFVIAAYVLPDGGKVSVSKLGGDGGGLAANINRWRGQVGFKPLPDKDVKGQPLKVAGSDEEMLLFNITAADSTEDAPGILAGVLPLKAETWYFKYSGPVGVLRKTERVFAEFLRTVRVGGGQESVPQPESSSNGQKGIHVTPPDGWTPSEGSSMRAASFSITGSDGISADVSVVPIPGNSGSILDNVNRWRSQLQLAPLASGDDPALGNRAETPAGEMFTSHMVSTEPIQEGKKVAIVSAILKRPGMTWFFKILGEASLVEANKEKFDTFVRSATFSE